MAEADAGDEWNSGEAVTVTLVDPDRNLNTGSDEDLTLSVTDRIPTIKIGSPLNFVQGSTGGNITINKVDGISGIATWTAVDFAASQIVEGAKFVSIAENISDLTFQQRGLGSRPSTCQDAIVALMTLKQDA